MLIQPFGALRQYPALTALPAANLIDNWDASIGGSVTVVTGVSAWASQVGGGHSLDQAIGAKQPSYAANTLTFDGIDDFLNTGAFALNQPTTVYFVGQQVAWATNKSFFDGNAGNSMRLYQVTATPQLSQFAGTGAHRNSDLTLGVDNVVASVFNGASSGIKVGSKPAQTGDVGAANAGGFHLGVNGAENQPSNIKVNQVVIYDVAHDAKTQNLIIEFLSNKWGI